MTNNDQPVGYFRESTDIRFLPAGVRIRLAPDTIITTPRPGMYKVNNSITMIEVMADAPAPALNETEAQKVLAAPPSLDPRGDNIIQGPWGQPIEHDNDNDEGAPA